MSSLKLIFFGNTKYSKMGVQIINTVFPISLIITIPDRISGRKKTLTPNPVKSWAKDKNIPALETDKLTKSIINQIKKINPDFLVVEDYGLILPNELLILPTYAPLNIHHSLLPKYRGPSPAPTAILNGDKISGVTIIKMADKVDCGDILAQKEYILSDSETTDSLLIHLNTLGAHLLVETIPLYIEGKIKPRVQNNARAIYCNRINKQDGYFDINKPPSSEKLDRMTRAYYPWPSVWTRWNGKIIKLYPGGVIQMEGKNKMPLKDFLNGYPNFPIKQLPG